MSDLSLECVDEFTAKLIRSKVRRLIGRGGFREADRDDLIQDFVADLLERLKNFDANKANLQAFVVVVCQNFYASVFERRLAAMRSPKREAGSLNQSIHDLEDTPTELGATIPDEQHRQRTGQQRRSDQETWDLAQDIRAVLDEMPPQMRLACELLMSNSKALVARKLGISRSALYEILTRIRNRFEIAGLHEYLDRFSDNSSGEPVVHQYLAFAAQKTRRPAMSPEVYRYKFASSVPLADVQASLTLAIMSTESLHGQTRVRLDARFAIDSDARTCVIDASTRAGRDLNDLFFGLISREFGADAFQVERPDSPAPRAAA